MKPEWILIANATRARLLEREPGCPLVVIESFDHPLSRSKTSDLADDRAGHDLTSVGLVELDQRVAHESAHQAGRP